MMIRENPISVTHEGGKYRFPSLRLVRQTLHEWLRETEWQHLSYLCVCSDPTVASKELDSIKTNQSDLDFAVTTESGTSEHNLQL